MPLATDTQLKIEETWQNQSKLKSIQKDKNSQLLFASGGTEAKVQQFTLLIKDSISDIQKKSDSLEQLI